MNYIVHIYSEFVSEKNASISIFESALLSGDMVYEKTRYCKKKKFKLREYLERLSLDIKILRISINAKIEELEQICYNVIHENVATFKTCDENRLMLNVSKVPIGIYSTVFFKRIETTFEVNVFPPNWSTYP